MASVLRLYDYAASANCYKARLVLAQLGIDYERVPVDIFSGETTTDAYREKNPAGRTPVLTSRTRPGSTRRPTPPCAPGSPGSRGRRGS